MTRLLLFTNEYPYRTGDHVFVQSEIDALAARFDSVVVFCHARDTSHPVVEMPANVTLGGNLYPSSPEDYSLKRLATPANLAVAAVAAIRELAAGRLFPNLSLFVRGVKAGVTRASRIAVHDAIRGDRDVVAYAFWGMGGGLALPWLRGVRGRALRLHRYDLYEYTAASNYLPFRRQLFARADRVLAISEDAQRYLSATYRSRALDRKIVVSRLGVFGPDHVTRAPRTPERLIVSVSSITAVKRVGLLRDAIAALPRREGETVRWVHFGDGPLMPELRAATSELSPDTVVELRGQTPNDDLHAFLASQRVDAFVNVSSSEGVPVSIMEALAYDIPVVATAVGGTPEVVGSELGSGELVAADASAEAIAETLREVLDAPDGSYQPRAVWERECDARLTSARTAELIAGLLRR